MTRTAAPEAAAASIGNSSASAGLRCGSVLYLAPRQSETQAESSPLIPSGSGAPRTSTSEPGLNVWYTTRRSAHTGCRKSSRTHSVECPGLGTGDHERVLVPAAG